MPTVCTTIKVSKDGQYILATGKHCYGYDLHTFDSRESYGGKGHTLYYKNFKHTEILEKL